MKVIAYAHDACFVEACTSEVICKSLRMNQISGGGEVSVVFDSSVVCASLVSQSRNYTYNMYQFVGPRPLSENFPRASRQKRTISWVRFRGILSSRVS